MLDDELRCQCLVGEGHVHDTRRMPLGRREVDQAAIRQHEHALALQAPLLHELPHRRRALGDLLQGVQVDLDVEVSGIRDDRPVLHCPHVFEPDDVNVARQRHEQVADARCFGHRDHPVAIHLGLERLQRVDLRDQHVRPGAAHPHGEPAPTPPVPRHHHRAPCDQEVRRPQDAVERGLPGAVAVVEQVLGVRIVDGHDREPQHTVLGHGPQTDHACGRLLCGPDHPRHQRLALRGGQLLDPAAYRGREIVEAVQRDHVERAHEVRAVVHRQIGPVGQRRAEVLVVGLVVFALDGVDLDAVGAHQVGRHVVLCGEWVRGAQRDIGPTRLQGDREVRCLGRDVQARRQPSARERPLTGEALLDLAQHRHETLGPVDSAAARLGQGEILDVVVDGGPSSRCRGHGFALSAV